MNQHAHAANPHIPHVVETPVPPPQGNHSVHIGELGGVPPLTLNSPVIEINDQHNAFFSIRFASLYEAFGPTTNDIEKKVKAIEEKLKAMESINVLGLDVAEICLVPGVIIPAKFKVPKFEKYKGAIDPRTHIRACCQKMVAYSNNDRLFMYSLKIL